VALTQQLTHSFTTEEVDRKWYIVDASGQTLGRLSSRVAAILRGKNKPTYTPHNDCGDFVVIINAEKIKIAQKRAEQKTYFAYTGYPGGASFTEFKELLKTHPERILEHAIKGMIPHNRLGARLIKKLKVYKGDVHPHTAQQPEKLTF
jgi:large subunit ribosomal protein L13